MKSLNPVYTWREWMIVSAYEDAQKGNYNKIKELQAVFGNPYKKNIFDQNGKLGFELGVAGAPETYLVNKQNKILYKHIGIMNEDIWNQKFLPLINE